MQQPLPDPVPNFGAGFVGCLWSFYPAWDEARRLPATAFLVEESN